MRAIANAADLVRLAGLLLEIARGDRSDETRIMAAALSSRVEAWLGSGEPLEEEK